MSVTDEQLASFISDRAIVCIGREEIDQRSLQAFPLAFSEQLLIVQYIYDFHVDGQLVLRKQDITSVTSRATDQFQKRLLHDQGLLQGIDFDVEIDLTSFSSVLDSQPPQAIVILENEGLEESEFWIGQFIDSKNERLRIREFSGAATWENDFTTIESRDISCCQLNSNYIQFYARYLANHPAPPITSTN